MKSILTRGALAAALALSLTACGGGKATFAIGGSVSLLRYGPLVLTTNGQDITVSPKSVNGETVSFSFPNTIEYGDTFHITIKSQPLHQTCFSQLTEDKPDTAGRQVSINIPFSCATNAYSIGGTISGLTTGKLTLTNGSTAGTVTVDSASVTNGTTTYTFPAVTWNDSYGVAVLTQPDGLNCTVQNGTGVMGDAKVENINVNCVPKG